jgi:N-acetylglucosamine-6-phosphate deacetylase
MVTLTAPRLLLDGALVADGSVTIGADGRIAAAGHGPPPEGEVRSLPTGTLAPGLVDAQLNGAFGHDLVDADEDAWHEVVQRLPETGVTAFVPTFITAPVTTLVAALHRYRELSASLRSGGGARSLGVHVEGPFLAPTRRGAHREAQLCDPTDEALGALLEAGGEHLSYLTLAPEREGAIDAIRTVRGQGVRVAIGHSDATDVQTLAAVDAGASLVTHLFNAQSPLDHRAPGVVGVALSEPRLTIGLIVDLHHVAPTGVRVAFAAAAGRVMLVTDAVAAMGMPPGTYELGGEPVEVLPDAPPVRPDGTIAGSALRLDAAVANTIACGIDPADALTAATRVPADALGRTDLGRIAPGLPADLVWLDDDWHARATWVGGRLVHGTDRPETAR